jgi:enoyl-CoA hydratase
MAERLASLPHQAIQETKRALNLHIQDYILRAAPFALMAEGDSFTTQDVLNTIEKFKAKQK